MIMDPKENLCYAIGCLCFATLSKNGKRSAEAEGKLRDAIEYAMEPAIDTGYINLLLFPMERDGRAITDSLSWALDALSYGRKSLTPELYKQVQQILSATAPATTEGAEAMKKLSQALEACNPTHNTETSWNSSCKVATL